MAVTADLDTLAGLPYAVEVVADTTTDGERCHLASHPELPGCMAHGETAEEAVANLAEARQLYIATLLEHHQEVPLPAATTPGKQ
jgi:predicted RNase H-like HicB family nuclease